MPVGGGCRKSRRSRPWSSLRRDLSNHHHYHTAILGHGENHAHDNNQLGQASISSYGNPRNLINTIEEESTSTEAQPTIDLAVVYANFLNQRPENNGDSSMVVNVPSNFESPLANEFPCTPLLNDTHIGNGPTSQLVLRHHHTTNMLDCPNNNSLSQALSMPPSSNKEMSIGLPSLPWVPSPLGGHHQRNCKVDTPGFLDFELELEPDAQLSNCFLGSWSTHDLPSFETFSSNLD